MVDIAAGHDRTITRCGAHGSLVSGRDQTPGQRDEGPDVTFGAEGVELDSHRRSVAAGSASEMMGQRSGIGGSSRRLGRQDDADQPSRHTKITYSTVAGSVRSTSRSFMPVAHVAPSADA